MTYVNWKDESLRKYCENPKSSLQFQSKIFHSTEISGWQTEIFEFRMNSPPPQIYFVLLNIYSEPGMVVNEACTFLGICSKPCYINRRNIEHQKEKMWAHLRVPLL